MLRSFGLSIACALAASSNAAVVGLDMMLSVDGGATWSHGLNSLAGTTVQVGIFALHDASCFGFAGAVVRINGTGLGVDDTVAITGVDSRRSPFNFGASNQAIFTSPGAFRIDNAADAADSSSLGVSISQRDPSSAGPNYVQTSGWLAYQFSIFCGPTPVERVISLSIDQVKNGVMTRHLTSGATSGASTTDWSVTGASIYLLPSPSSFAMLAVSGLIAGRRRR